MTKTTRRAVLAALIGMMGAGPVLASGRAEIICVPDEEAASVPSTSGIPWGSMSKTMREQLLPKKPVIQVTYSPDGDAGLPGLFFVGAINTDMTIGAVMDLSGEWVPYQGGMYPPAQRFDNGLPPVIVLQMDIPRTVDRQQYERGTPWNASMSYGGFGLFAGHGALSLDMQEQIATRRQFLTEHKDELIQKGAWSATYEDDDDHVRRSMVQNDMDSNNKYVRLITIPNTNPCYDAGSRPPGAPGAPPVPTGPSGH